MNLGAFYGRYVQPKIRFGLAGIVATAVDHVLYLILIAGMAEWKASFISYAIAMVVNFFLQKRFIFDLKRKPGVAFLLSMTFSLGGLFFSAFLVKFFSQYPFFAANRYLNKLTVTGIIFIYNFYTKRFAFEKKIKGL